MNLSSNPTIPKYAKGLTRLSVILSILIGCVFCSAGIDLGLLAFVISLVSCLLLYCFSVIFYALGLWIWEGFKS